MKNKRRLNLALTDVTNKRLESLQKFTGATTETEVIAKALVVYELVVNIKANDEKFLVSNAGNMREIVLL